MQSKELFKIYDVVYVRPEKRQDFLRDNPGLAGKINFSRALLVRRVEDLVGASGHFQYVTVMPLPGIWITGPGACFTKSLVRLKSRVQVDGRPEVFTVRGLAEDGQEAVITGHGHVVRVPVGELRLIPSPSPQTGQDRRSA